MLFQGSLVVILVTKNIWHITPQSVERLVQIIISITIVLFLSFSEHYQFFQDSCLEMLSKSRYRSYPVDFSILSDFSEEDLEGLMDLGIKYSGQISYAEPEEVFPPSYQVDWTPRSLCEGFGNYSTSHGIATSWATSIIMAAEASLQMSEDVKLSLKYVLKCLPEYHEEKPNDVTPADILRFVTDNGLISEEDALYLDDSELCSDETSTKYFFEVNQNIVPNRSGLKNLTAEGDPVIVLMAIDLNRLRTTNNVTGNFTFTGAASNPSLYAVMTGYDEEKWNVTFNVVPCENIVLQLPVTDSESNANYAGIAGYSFSMKFHEARGPTPPAPNLVKIRIEVHYGANSEGSRTLTFNEGYGDSEVLSISLTGGDVQREIGWIPSHLLNIKLVDVDSNWSDDSYFIISYEDGKSDPFKLSDIPSEGLFYHYSHGIVDDSVTVSNCGDVPDALKNHKIVYIPDGVCRDETTFTYDETDEVIYIKIGDNNFRGVSNFVIDEKANLEYIQIGINSFTQGSGSGRRLGDPNKNFQVLNCPKLQSIEIGKMSFADYGGLFELSNLPLLKTLIIGSITDTSNNFYSASFDVQGMLIYIIIIIN